METQVNTSTKATDETQVRQLYNELLKSWNRRNAQDFAALFTTDGNCVGFDGSQLDGQQHIKSELEQIFAHHQTAVYIGIVREIRFLVPAVALLHAVSGMTPQGQKTINPAVNATQSLVAVKHNDQWRIALFQNTPAAFHGRPELSKQLTEELQQALNNSRDI